MRSFIKTCRIRAPIFRGIVLSAPPELLLTLEYCTLVNFNLPPHYLSGSVTLRML
jgi:hypothetical protein